MTPHFLIASEASIIRIRQGSENDYNVVCLCSFLGQEMSSDDRAFLMQAVLSMSPSVSTAYFYPRVLPLVSHVHVS